MKYFVSDFHFGAKKPAEDLIVSQFENFCNSLSDGDELYILGDFFDFWIEYKSVVRADFALIYSILLSTKRRGIEIFMIRGNHDFIRGSFLESLGIKLFDKEVKFEQNGKKVFCAHGDEITGRLWRKIVARVFRNSFSQFFYKVLHPDFAIGLAQACSELSRNKSKSKKNDRSDERKQKYRECAFRLANTENYDLVILGHSHICDLAKAEEKIYANSGIWFERPTYLLLDEKKIFLKEFSGDLQKDIILEEKEF